MSITGSVARKATFWQRYVDNMLGRRRPVLDPNAVFVQRVLKVFGDAYAHEDLLWMVDDLGKVSFMANVSDTFDWGSADGEPILPRHLGELEKAYRDLKALEDGEKVQRRSAYTQYVAMLYAARRRQMRPMARAYPPHAGVALLLDACGGNRG